MPDATNLFDYNRYMYARGNPMRYNDPTGYCATLSNGASDENDGECWRYANTILAQWDNTPGYWNERFYSKDNFLSMTSNRENHADGFHDVLTQYGKSAAYQAWAAQHPSNPISPAELADPMCAGNGACQAFGRASNRVDAYCQAHDCEGIAIDSIGAASVTRVALVCIPGFAACAIATAVGTVIGFTTGGGSVVRTATLVAQGSDKVTKTDLLVSSATFVIGTVVPAVKLSNRAGAIVGLGAGAVQMG